MQKNLNLHLLSDATCQTLKTLANAIISRFDGYDVKKYYWPLLQNQADLENCFDKIAKKPGIVLYTLRDQQIINKLHLFCQDMNIECIGAIDHLLNRFSTYLCVAPSTINYTRLNDQYFDKLQALDFVLKHDDGKLIESINQADIIIVGVSRSSKTPTAIYLAHNGYKTANVPYIKGIDLPESLKNINNKLIVGLVINPSRLAQIRYTRLSELHKNPYEAANSSYADFAYVLEECNDAKKVFLQNNWPIIDITYKSIEETAAVITKLYYLFETKKI